MKTFSATTLLLFLSLLLLSARVAPQPERWIVQKGSTLMVQGKTNINTFNCGITGYDACDTILVTEHPAINKSFLLNGAVYLDVFRFDCFNKIMTSELRKTLKAETFPRMKIRFITLDRVPFSKNQKAYINGVVDIELAGAHKRFSVAYHYSTGTNPAVIDLVGTKTINFSDFALKPPKKLNGMVQAKDALDIQFHLVLRRV